MSDDEFAAYDFSEFTDADLAQIDAAFQEGGPALPIEIEAADVLIDTLQQSPFRRFRKYKFLSVTDLVAPAWCEVQFDYGLHQKRHKQLAHRPASFVSAAGKTISVVSEVAARNDVRVTKGQALHKTLERELKPVEVIVRVNTEEERWGLRLVNMVDAVNYLMTIGCAREIPVFGIVHGNVVIGIIDELVRKPVSELSPSNGPESRNGTPKPKKSRRSRSPSQSAVTDFFQAPSVAGELPSKIERLETPPPQAAGADSSHQYALHLLDTKSRTYNSLPNPADTITSRLQVMLYSRLLSELISTSSPFDFPFLWTTLELDPTAPFSAKFKKQAGLENATCLNDLVSIWADKVLQLDVAGVDSTLRLVYRMRPQHGDRKKGKKRKEQATLLDFYPEQQEECDLQRAIAESLKTAVLNREAIEAQASASEDIPGRSLETDEIAGVVEDLPADSDLALILQQSLLDQELMGAPTTADEILTSSDADNSVDAPKIIGTTEVIMDAPFLDKHLKSILKWWHGQRKPVGVSVKETNRCFTCEYKNDCEWREMKAAEESKDLEDPQL